MKSKQNGKAATLSNNLLKTGMVATMGATVYSGFAGPKLVRLLHPWAGLALVCFSILHHHHHTRKKLAGR